MADRRPARNPFFPYPQPFFRGCHALVTGHASAHRPLISVRSTNELHQIMNELIVLRERSRIEASDYRTELYTLMAATPQPTPAQYPQLEHIMHQLLLRLDREARFSRTLVHCFQELLQRDPRGLMSGPLP